MTIGEQTFAFRAKDIFVAPTARRIVQRQRRVRVIQLLGPSGTGGLRPVPRSVINKKENHHDSIRFAPQAPISIPVVGSDEQFPVRRVYCVGRNYAAHAREMGFDPDREPPFFL